MLFRDLAFATRTLRKSPVFTATAVITIALGIGAATAIFTVANAVLLRPLPYKNPDRLVFAIADMRNRNVKDFFFSDADFLDMRNGSTAVFEDVAAVRTGRGPIPREDGTPELVNFANVSTNFFRTMGAKTVLGRDFVESDGIPAAAPTPGSPPVTPPLAMTILSYNYWQRRFGGSRDIVGKSMPGGQGGTQIVGVLAPGFELLFPAETNLERLPDAWFATRLQYDNAQRNSVAHKAIARLRNGVSLETAQAAVDRVAAETRKNYIISGTAGYAIRLEPMQKHLVEEVRPALLALIGAVAFLLLIACANVANLLLVRSSLRERELAVRTALGGDRWALITQTFAEALLLAFGGAALGLALAWAGLRELRAIAPPNLPRLDAIAIDPLVVGFSIAAAFAAAAIFGILPALRASRPDIAIVLRGAGRSAGLGSAGWLRSAVVVGEVAMCFVLLVGSGLMFRSFRELQRIDPGFDSNHLVTFLISGRNARTPEARLAFIREFNTRLGAIPGVQSLTASNLFPLAGGYSPIRWGLEAALSDPSRFQAVDSQSVLPGYFETVRTPLIAGRTFTDADNARDRNLVVVDQVLAAKAFPNQSAVGKRILIRLRTPEPEWVEIIGVVQHVRNASLAVAGREQVYFTNGFTGHDRVSRWALRVAGDPAAYAAPIRAAVVQQGRNLVITELQPAADLVNRAQAATRFQLLLIGVFASIALLLAAVGLYGVLSTFVRQRTAEIGVRMALGAAPASIFSLVVGHGLRLSLAGIAAGIAAAIAVTRVMQSMLIGIEPTDPLTYAGMIALFFLIAGVSSWLPARRAAALDPTVALRGD